MAIEAGAQAPEFSLQTPAGAVSIPDRDGRVTVLMFFREAGTPLCSTQVTSLNREAQLLAELGAVAVCASTDPLARQAEFAASLGGLDLLLASDLDGEAAKLFGVYDPVQRRAQRSAFIIAGDGTVRLAIPWYNPANSEQLLSIFSALGLGADVSGDKANG